MIWYPIFIILIFVLAIFNNKVSKKLLYPPTLLCLIWVLVIVLHFTYILFSKYKPNQLSFKTLLFFYLALVFYTLGSFIAKGIEKTHLLKTVGKYSINKYCQLFLVLFSVSNLCFFIAKIYEIVGVFDLRLFRYYTSVERVDIGLVKYTIYINIFIAILFAINFYSSKSSKVRDKIGLLIVVLIALITSILSSSRGTVLLLVLSLAGIYSNYRKINGEKLFKAISVLLAVFVGMAIILKKSLPNSNSNKLLFIDRIEHLFYSYVCLPLSAFNEFFNKPYEILYGDILFRFPNALMYKIGLVNSPSVNLVESYVSVPDGVNVFTAYYKLIKDFGVVYAFFFMLLFSVIHSLLFFKSKDSLVSLIMYSVLLFPCVMLFFEEHLISLLSTWIQFLVYAYLANKILIKDNR